MLEAAPIAARPATPAPATSTFAGGTLPAAVTCPVKKRPNSWAASTTARYPEMLAMELRTSIDCAREMRGTASSASAVIPRCDRAARRSGRSPGLSDAIRVAPSASSAISSSTGGATLSTMSAAHALSRGTMRAPAAANASSVNAAPTPAPRSTTTS